MDSTDTMMTRESQKRGLSRGGKRSTAAAKRAIFVPTHPGAITPQSDRATAATREESAADIQSTGGTLPRGSVSPISSCSPGSSHLGQHSEDTPGIQGVVAAGLCAQSQLATVGDTLAGPPSKSLPPTFAMESGPRTPETASTSGGDGEIVRAASDGNTRPPSGAP